MKKLLMLLVSLVMVFSTFNFVCAVENDVPVLISAIDDSIKVMQDGEYIDFTDSNGSKVEPQIINSRTMVPFRKIFNSLGVIDEDITWIPETRTVIAKKDNVEIELQIDNNVAKKTVSGETSSITLDSAPVIYESRTLVPVRFIAESMEKLVGWDAENRTVIIIDKVKVENELESALPKYFELISLQTESINTMDSTMVLKGAIAYTSKSEKENNSTLNFTANIDLKKSEKDIMMKVDISFTGKGMLYEAIKENNLTKLDFTVIMSEDKMYIKSSLLDGETDGKWLVMEEDSLAEIMKLLNTTYSNPSKADLLPIKEEDLNIHTYEQLQMTIKLLKELLGDDNITITGTKTKKYEVNIDLIDFIKSMGDFGLDLDDIDIIKELTVKGGGTIEDGVAKSSNAKIKFDMEEDGEKIAIEVTADSKINSYNKAVNIDIPSENEVMNLDD